LFKISYLQEFLKKLQEKSFEKFAYIGKLLYLCSDFQPRFPKKNCGLQEKEQISCSR